MSEDLYAHGGFTRKKHQDMYWYEKSVLINGMLVTLNGMDCIGTHGTNISIYLHVDTFRDGLEMGPDTTHYGTEHDPVKLKQAEALLRNLREYLERKQLPITFALQLKYGAVLSIGGLGGAHTDLTTLIGLGRELDEIERQSDAGVDLLKDVRASAVGQADGVRTIRTGGAARRTALSDEVQTRLAALLADSFPAASAAQRNLVLARIVEIIRDGPGRYRGH